MMRIFPLSACLAVGLVLGQLVAPTFIASADAASKPRMSISSSSSSRPSFNFNSSSRSSQGSSALWNRSTAKSAVVAPSRPVITTPAKPTVATAPSRPSVSTAAAPSRPSVTTVIQAKPSTVAIAPATRKIGQASGAVGAAVSGKAASPGLAAYRTDSSRFVNQTTSATVANADKYRQSPAMRRVTTTRVTYDTIQNNRNRTFSNWSRPSYMYDSYNTFGQWDANFLWWAMVHQPAFFYHHNNDPSIIAWRREADRLANQNADLRTQLASLDTTNKGITTPRQEDFLPPEVDPTVAFVPELLAQPEGDGTLTVGTGGTGGMYYAFCMELKKNYAKTECVSTNGSMENQEGLSLGRFGAIAVQSNVVLPETGGLQASLYPEVVFLLTNKNAQVSAIGDVDSKRHNLYVAGSGAYATLANFVYEDSGYSTLYQNAIQVQPNNELIDRVASDPKGVMLFVCAVNCPLLAYANEVHGGKLQLAAMDDWDFDDARNSAGDYLYRFVKLDPKVYPNLSPKGWFGKGSVETLAVEAVFTISDAWIQQNGMEAKGQIERAMWPALTAIQNKAGLPVE